jgi:hypothetical protein
VWWNFHRHPSASGIFTGGKWVFRADWWEMRKPSRGQRWRGGSFCRHDYPMLRGPCDGYWTGSRGWSGGWGNWSGGGGNWSGGRGDWSGSRRTCTRGSRSRSRIGRAVFFIEGLELCQLLLNEIGVGPLTVPCPNE